ncbi:MAG: 4Fe-4S binding protein [Clostridia bacterium]|nr:4Fe-4S binding protein [Clostridia bacterium]
MIKTEIPTLFESKKDCSGCSACYAVCPKRAIKMVSDNEGFLYPQIDEKLCVNCKLCANICPFKENTQRKEVYEEDNIR